MGTMEPCYLERLSLERKEEILAFLAECHEDNPEVHGSGGMDRIYRGWTFEDALERCLNFESPEYAAKTDWCPGKTRLLVRERDRRIVGVINIRWNLTERARQFAGHIGYTICPSERRKGYASQLLRSALRLCHEMGVADILVCCAPDNEGSKRTILRCGGVLEAILNLSGILKGERCAWQKMK